MPNSRTSEQAAVGLLLLATIVGCAALIHSISFVIANPANNDFICFVTGARVLIHNSANLYSLNVQQMTQAGILGIPPAAYTDVNGFIAPPPVAALFVPLQGFPLRTGVAIAVCASLALYVGSWRIVIALLPKHWSSPQLMLTGAALVVSLPAAVDVLLVQTDPLVLMACLASVLLLQRDHHLAGGMALAAAFAKPQLFFLVPLILICAGRWRVLAGMAIGGMLWIAVSLALVGPSVLLSAAGFVSSLSHQFSLPVLLNSRGRLPIVTVVVTTLVIALAIAYRRRLSAANPAYIVLLGTVGSMMATPHLGPEDALALVGIGALAARNSIWWAVIAVFLLDISEEAQYLAIGNFVAIFLLGVAALGILCWVDMTKSAKGTYSDASHEAGV